MEYKEYQHVVKLDDPEVDGLLVGKCYVFPKIDGTNGTVWLNENHLVGTGSRHRDMSKEGSGDNQGFRAYIEGDTRFTRFFDEFSAVRLYGEWLVPHTLKTYRDDAWRKFYVFDTCIYSPETNEESYVNYEEYSQWLKYYGIDFIPPIKIITNPTHDQLLYCAEQNTFLIKENSGAGEGVVIKNYDFVNRYGRVTWGKIVRNEFKDKFHKEMGSPELMNRLIEKELVDKFLSKTDVDKVVHNVKVLRADPKYTWCGAEGSNIEFEKGWIPQLLETAYYEFVREEIWSMVKYLKANKTRSIDFNNLKQHAFNKVKEYYPQLFRRNINENTSTQTD